MEKNPQSQKSQGFPCMYLVSWEPVEYSFGSPELLEIEAHGTTFNSIEFSFPGRNYLSILISDSDGRKNRNSWNLI